MKNLTKRASALLLTLLGVALLSAAQVKLTPIGSATNAKTKLHRAANDRQPVLIFPNLKPAPRTCPTQKTPQTTKQALSLVNSQKCLVGLALAFAKQEAHAP